MAEYLADVAATTTYVDRKVLLASTSEEQYLAERNALMRKSATVYIGNLGFYTTEAQVWLHFAAAGPVRDVIMGINTLKRQPCGFCFVEYEDQASALAAIADLHLTRLDDRVVRVTCDVGDVRAAGRFWGRGFSGGQTRDDYRQDLDKARGGLGLRRAVENGVERTEVADAIVAYDWVPLPQARNVSSGKAQRQFVPRPPTKRQR
jgi:nuclear cap-binding protein subunit 2